MSAGLTIGKAAEAAGVGIETIRFYEREQLIERPLAAPGSGPRRYPPDLVQRIRFIRETQQVGFSLREVRDLLTLQAAADAGESGVAERAREQRTEVMRKVAQLQRLSAALENLVTGQGTWSRLTDAFANVPSGGTNDGEQ